MKRSKFPFGAAVLQLLVSPVTAVSPSSCPLNVRLFCAPLPLCVALLTFFVLTLQSGAADLRFDRWRWSNPQPHGNNVMDMLVTSSLILQVGDGGSVHLQGEDDRWVPATTGVTNYLRGVAMLGSRYIAVGENGCIIWSDDAARFQPAEVLPPTTDWFEAVAASGQRAVAVGDNGTIYVSTNGTTWTQVTSGTSQWLRGVAFGGSAFVAVGEYGTILKSANTSATSWAPATSQTTSHLNRVRYLPTSTGNQFIAVGASGVLRASTTGGGTWTIVSTGTTNTLFDVATSSIGTLVVGEQEIRLRHASTGLWTNQITGLVTNSAPSWTYYTAYGTTNYWLVAGRAGLLLMGSRTNGVPADSWAPLPNSSHAWLWDMTVQKGICVAVGDLATIQTSLDGILWAREAVPGSYTNVVLLGVGGTTNMLLASGNNGTVFYSLAGMTNMTVTNYVGTNVIVTNQLFETLGLIWNAAPTFTTNSLQGVAADHALYTVCGGNGAIFTTANGTNWTPRFAPTTNFLSGIASCPQGWVVSGRGGTLLWSDPSAASWQPANLSVPTTNWLYRVRMVGGQLVAVGQNGTLYTSSDAVNWIARASGTSAWLNDVTFASGKWWVVGTKGSLLSSADLATWIPTPSPTVKSLYGAASLDGKLLTAGVDGVILRNQIEPFTTPVNLLDYSRTVVMTGTNASGYLAVYELFLFGGAPDQVFQFQSGTNVSSVAWTTNATFEIFDSAGTIYALRTRGATNTPPREFYRTLSIP